MGNALQVILINILISIIIFLIIAIVLILIDGKPKNEKIEQNNLSFEGLAIGYSKIPPQTSYKGRMVLI